jgi:hypothetical protein
MNAPLNTGYEAHTGSNLVDGGLNEDGEQIVNELYHITIENLYGDRWVSRRTFETAEAAEAFLPRVTAALAAGADPRTSDRWAATYPVYGSAAYVAYGQADEVAWEARMDGRA